MLSLASPGGAVKAQGCSHDYDQGLVERDQGLVERDLGRQVAGQGQ